MRIPIIAKKYLLTKYISLHTKQNYWK